MRAALAARLAPDMLVVRHDGVVLATRASAPDAERRARRIAATVEAIGARAFPDRPRRVVAVVLADDGGRLGAVVERLYPGASGIPADGFYHPGDRLMVAPAPIDGAGLRREITRALLRDAHPQSPDWLEAAAVNLFEASEWRDGRLVPVPDARMADIPPDEDLGSDVFAGICDCSAVPPGQVALMRLLMIFLDERDRLPALFAAADREGRYATMLQLLDAMPLDAAAWEAYAGQARRAYGDSRF